MPSPVLPDDVRPGETPVPRQRVGAYGVLLRSDNGTTQILMTRISQKDYGAGMWTLPGGGIDHGEHPDDAVLREFHEETSLRVEVDQIAAVSNLHIYGRNRAGVLEDFQGLGVIYLVRACEGVDIDQLEILEDESSTDLVQWVDLDVIDNGERRLTNVALVGIDIARRW